MLTIEKIESLQIKDEKLLLIICNKNNKFGFYKFSNDNKYHLMKIKFQKGSEHFQLDDFEEIKFEDLNFNFFNDYSSFEVSKEHYTYIFNKCKTLFINIIKNMEKIKETLSISKEIVFKILNYNSFIDNQYFNSEILNCIDWYLSFYISQSYDIYFRSFLEEENDIKYYVKYNDDMDKTFITYKLTLK